MVGSLPGRMRARARMHAHTYVPAAVEEEAALNEKFSCDSQGEAYTDSQNVKSVTSAKSPQPPCSTESGSEEELGGE